MRDQKPGATRRTKGTSRSTTIRRPSGGWQSWSTRRRVLTGAGLVLVIWGLVVVVTALGARSTLQQAESGLLQARASLADGNVDDANAALVEAGELLADARASLFRPDMGLASLVPVLGRDLQVARTIVDAANEVVGTSRAALDAATLLADGDLSEDGLPVDELAALAPTVRAAATATAEAVVRIGDSPRPITPEVRDGRDRVLDILTPIADQLSVAADLVEVLPDFLGANGPRRYFVGAANPAELRGVGGYLGSYAVLTIDDGRLEFGPFQPLNQRADLSPGDIPTDALPERYEEFGATWQWKNVNMTPDLPSAARTMTLMWARQTGQRLDGVIIVDPFALETMLRVTGPIETPDSGTLVADTVVAYLTNGAYADFDDTDVRKETLGEAAKLVLEAFLGRGADLVDRAGDLGRLVTDRQLLLYSTDPATQDAFRRSRIDGALPDPEGDMIAAVVNSATNAKLDFFLDRTLRYDVELLADGDAFGELVIDLHNAAPSEGEPLYVIGPNLSALVAGQNQFYFSTYCSSRCEITQAAGGLSGRSKLTSELGHPVAGSWVQIPSKGTETMRYGMRTDDAWAWDGGDLVYRLLIRTQTAVRAPKVDVRVLVPEGFRFGGGTAGIEVEEGHAVFRAEKRGDLQLEFRFSVA